MRYEEDYIFVRDVQNDLKLTECHKVYIKQVSPSREFDRWDVAGV